MLNRPLPLRSLQRTFLAIALSIILAACTFDVSGIPGLVQFPEDTPVTELTSGERVLVLEEPGSLAVFHGYGCAESDKPGKEDFIRVQESMDIPDYATTATVFLNGWQLQYLNGDNNVNGLGTGIVNIKLTNSGLSWEAGGVLSDKNFDNGYGWCYYYTILAWNETLIDARPDHGGTDQDHVFENYQDNSWTALKLLPGLIHNVDFVTGEQIAVLPRGFGFTWDFSKDHNLLQLAYNLDYSETFIEYGKEYLGSEEPALMGTASYVDSGFVSWETKTVFKDDSIRDYYAGEVVSALGGHDVGIVHPPFSLLPHDDIPNSCLGSAISETTEEYVIKNVPFEYAVPMLTGWDVAYVCGDENVKEVGVWIPKFEYEKLPGEPVGTLRYEVSSVLRDEDGKPGHTFKHRVSILGLQSTAGEGMPTAVILAPKQNDTFIPGAAVALQGEGIDPEDGVLSGSNLLWFSDRDGFLGSGNSIQVTLSGPETPCHPEYVSHTLTLVVTDSDGHQTTQQIVVLVGRTC